MTHEDKNIVEITAKIEESLLDTPYRYGLPDYLWSPELKKLAKRFPRENQKLGDLLGSVIVNEVYKHISNTEELSDKDKKISAAQANTIAVNAVNTVSSYPYEYRFVFHLPQTEYQTQTLSSSLRLVKIEDSNLANYIAPSPKPAGALHQLVGGVFGNPPVKIGDTVLEAKILGYAERLGLIITSSGTATLDPLYIFKNFMAAHYVYDAIEANPSQLASPYDLGINKQVYTYLVYPQKSSTYSRDVNVSPEDNEMVSRKRLNVNSRELLPKLKKLFEGVNIHKPGSELGKYRQRLQNALYWYHELEKTKEGHLQAIHLSSCIDAIVGDERTRRSQKAEIIAKSVTNSAAEEIVVQQAIDNLYAYRNRIVHGELTISTIDDSTSEGEKRNYERYISKQYIKRFLKRSLEHYVSSF